jgi:hypothetical protein
VIRGERFLLSIAFVILIPQSREKNLGLNSELIHNRNRPEMFLPRLRDQHDSAIDEMTPNLFQ